MKTRSIVFSMMTMVGCSSEKNQNTVELVTQVDSGSVSSSEEQKLSLMSEDGKFNFADLSGPRVNAAKAFGSYILYRDNRGGRCSGVRAYERRPDGKADVYFYTAVHCMEPRTPLGRRVKIEADFHNAKSMKSPFVGTSDVVEVSLNKVAVPEQFRFYDAVDRKYRGSDVARIHQGTQDIASAGKYLPVCEGDSAAFTDMQAIGYRGKSTIDHPVGLYWANFERAIAEARLPASTEELLEVASNRNRFGRAVGVRAKPGDSGSPVFAIRKGIGPQVNEYLCLYGIITRELWMPPKCGTDCPKGGQALYERVQKTDVKAGTWFDMRLEDL